MNHNPLLALAALGQSVWIDFIRRGVLASGELERWIAEDGVSGVTSNPSIFEKAIAGSHDYDAAIRALALQGKSVDEMLEALTVDDVQRTADLLRPVFDRTHGADGFVSLEVSPDRAHHTAATIAEARRLWAAVGRPNALIKVPATREGVPAIRRLVAEGINVNVTLLFGLPRYREVADAYLSGLEERAASGADLGRVASVASFFLSRIDVLVDAELDRIGRLGGARGTVAELLVGEVAVACAKTASRMHQDIFGGRRFADLAARGARPQRLLWASTSTKNPAYSDVKYVDALVGPGTITTVPLETLDAYRDHGRPEPRLSRGVESAREVLKRLADLGIDLEAVARRLEEEGVRKFAEPWHRLRATLETKRLAALAEPVDRHALNLGPDAVAVEERIRRLRADRFLDKVWRKDPTAFRRGPADHASIRGGLGWLHLAQRMEAHVGELEEPPADIRGAGFRRAVLLGMGGSSMTALVLARTFAPAPGGLPVVVLDTTDPATILRVERAAPLEETLFVVASKSGTTAETRALGDYFYERVRDLLGERARDHFVAITDPGTLLALRARALGFRRTFLGFPDVGGRYSALSHFGLVPAALLGLDVGELLARALRMGHACASCVSAPDHPAVSLGAALGELALRGRDKVTFVLSPAIAGFGAWLEQLLAESTGKDLRGLLPVIGEPVAPSMAGGDRFFVHLRLRGAAESAEERAVAALRPPPPVATILLEDPLDLAQELFRWELATATAGAVLGVNPFDQPDVERSKIAARALLERVPSGARLPEPEPSLREGPLSVFAAPARARSLRALLRELVTGARPGDYLSLQAYLPESPEIDGALASLRRRLRDASRVATTSGYGPRLLHSAGQYHKGGPPKGLFLQLTADDPEDVRVPGERYGFGALTRALALGDLEVLRRRGRPVLRVHLGADAASGLTALEEALDAALATGVAA